MRRRDWMSVVGGSVLVGSVSALRNAIAQSHGGLANPPPAPPSFGPAVRGLQLGLQWVNNFTLTFVLQNVSSAPIRVLSHVVAGATHLDWYALEIESLTSAALPMRTLHFIEPRTRSARVIAPIAPGAQLAHTVDTRTWGRSPSNPPPAGWQPSTTYRITLRYDTSSETGGVWAGRLVSGVHANWIDLG